MALDRVEDRVEVRREDFLYRRLAPSHVKPDGVVSSTAFMYSGVPMSEVSVDLARLTTPFECLARERRPGWRLGELRAAVPLDLDLTVRHDPKHDPDSDNPAHCLIVGLGPDDMTQCYMMARQTRVLDLPPT
ncbi:MAG: hypothetical protein H0V51_06395 [Chloroflexi bacterium]|nr:hypothetical protein [Chloroflexota bacterium]